VRESTVSPRACSGEKYWAVPRIMPVCATLALVSLTARAMPKSITLICPPGVTMTLPGLMSRCTMPARCEYSSAVRMPLVMRTASDSGSGPSAMMSFTMRPSTYSITMYGTAAGSPSGPTAGSSPASNTRTTVGCDIRAADCASCRKRVRNSGSSESSGLSSFTATCRSSLVSRARCTCAMPP
jgi:hypothetical protein